MTHEPSVRPNSSGHVLMFFGFWVFQFQSCKIYIFFSDNPDSPLVMSMWFPGTSQEFPVQIIPGPQTPGLRAEIHHRTNILCIWTNLRNLSGYPRIVACHINNLGTKKLRIVSYLKNIFRNPRMFASVVSLYSIHMTKLLKS